MEKRRQSSNTNRIIEHRPDWCHEHLNETRFRRCSEFFADYSSSIPLVEKLWGDSRPQEHNRFFHKAFTKLIFACKVP